MKQKIDILQDCQELKKMPFTVPEGYFESFKKEVRKPMVQKLSFRKIVMPYIAVAAMFAFMVTTGTLLLERSTPEYQMTEEDYFMFSDNMMNTIAYEMEYGTQFAEAEINDEDIINYLIYTGVTAEQIEFYK
ncbi:MAG: hypothetical protein J6V17_04040 [Bacteroidales bacterium]|nr:hypothetical protein [Bacteroidales bacterium]